MGMGVSRDKMCLVHVNGFLRKDYEVNDHWEVQNTQAERRHDIRSFYFAGDLARHQRRLIMISHSHQSSFRSGITK